MEFFRAQLERAGSFPLELVIQSPHRDSGSDPILQYFSSCDLVSNLIPRVQSLTILGNGEVDTFLYWLTGRAERMESLHIDPGSAIPNSLFAGGVPRLRELERHLGENVDIPWNSAIFRSKSLNRLSLNRPCDDAPKLLTLSQLYVSLLPFSSRLTFLRLPNVVRNYGRVVTLPETYIVRFLLLKI